MKLVDIKLKTYINFTKENNYKDPKFKVDDYVRISKYKNILTKSYVSSWSDEVFVIKKAKNLCCGRMLLVILMEKKLLLIIILSVLMVLPIFINI